MSTLIKNEKYKQLTKNQSTFLNSLIKYNDAYFLEAKWMMARNSDETKEQLAILFSQIFSVHDHKIVWSTNLRIFMGNENAKMICGRQFAALKDHEKTAEFFNFVCEYFQSSLLFNFDDVKAEKDFYEFFKLRMVMSIIAKDEGHNYQIRDYSTKLHRFVTTSDIFDPLHDDNFFATFDSKMFSLAKIGFSRLFNQDYQAAIILIRLVQYVFSTLILTSLASSFYYFVMGDTAMAALAGFCIAPLMLFESAVHGIGVKKQASIKENAKIEFQEISKRMNESISVKLYKFIDKTGSKHVYHAVDVRPFEAPAAPVPSQPTTIQPSTSSQEHAIPTPFDPKPKRVRPKSKFSQKPTPQTVVKTANARLFEAVQKKYPRQFTEDDVINLPNKMKGILDRRALVEQKNLLDPTNGKEKLKAIHDTFKTSNERPFLKSKGFEKNGIKPGFDTGYTCPLTGARKISHSYIKNVSTGIRVHGSHYSTDEGNVIIYNIGAPK